MFLNKKIIFSLLNFIFFVVVAGFLYKNIYCKKEILYNERCSVYKRFVSINKQIDDFSTIKMKIAEQEGFFIDIFNLFSSVLYPNDMIKNSYKTKIIDLLKTMEIDYEYDLTDQLLKEETYFGIDSKYDKTSIYVTIMKDLDERYFLRVTNDELDINVSFELEEEEEKDE